MAKARGIHSYSSPGKLTLVREITGEGTTRLQLFSNTKPTEIHASTRISNANQSQNGGAAEYHIQHKPGCTNTYLCSSEEGISQPHVCICSRIASGNEND